MAKHKVTIKEPLRLIDGKFLRGDQEEPAEIGNREQIELLQQAERELKAAHEKGMKGEIECDFSTKRIRYTSTIEFECVCGEEVEEELLDRTTEDWEELEDSQYDWDEEIVKCPYCGRKYKINCGYAKLIG